MNSLKKCLLCPRNCGIDRYNITGYCKANSKLRIALASIHMWEEPCISGTNGSGTIFFSNCNLKCIFCQNKKISDGYGQYISIDRFSKICLELQDKNVHNINLVTPTHYVPMIIKGIKKSKNNGLTIPVVYNTSSYENIETIQSLENTIDVYLADLKYYDNKYAEKYSNCKNYFYYASRAIDEMYKQVGKFVIKNDIMIKGLIVRILLLPGLVEDAKKIVKYLYTKYGDNIYISLMNQYTPINKSIYPELNNKVLDKEYDELIDYSCDLGVTNAFIQEGKTQSDSFIPNFNKEGVMECKKKKN